MVPNPLEKIDVKMSPTCVNANAGLGPWSSLAFGKFARELRKSNNAELGRQFGDQMDPVSGQTVVVHDDDDVLLNNHNVTR